MYTFVFTNDAITVLQEYFSLKPIERLAPKVLGLKLFSLVMVLENKNTGYLMGLMIKINSYDTVGGILKT